LDFFRKLSGIIEGKKILSPILLKAIPFDAKSDGGESYMVVFVLFWFYIDKSDGFRENGEIP